MENNAKDLKRPAVEKDGWDTSTKTMKKWQDVQDAFTQVIIYHSTLE